MVLTIIFAIILFPVVVAAIWYCLSLPATTQWGQLINVAFFTVCVSVVVVLVILWLQPGARNKGEKRSVNSVDAYFETIRNDEAALTAFFSLMPKGGDLHNHFTGSIYAEYFLDNAINKKWWVDPATLKIEADPGKIKKTYKRLDTLVDKKDFPDLKQRLFQEWSVKDYYDAYRPADKHFFDAFAKFPNDTAVSATREALLELKTRAKIEHVQYLEIMIGSVVGKLPADKYIDYDKDLRHCSAIGDQESMTRLFQALYKTFEPAAIDSARIFGNNLHGLHDKMDDDDLTVRYLCFVKREARPVDVFRGLIAAFKAAWSDSLIGGVNIVSREDGELAMKDYALHMQMFKFLKGRDMPVNCTLHAGELTLGLVKPEDLTWHIRSAVYTAGAKRIGHGTDVAYESNCDSLLKYMSREKIAVEINLLSNEFILKVKDDNHPIMLYADHQVPIVISTDDAGILRTNLIAQFVALGKRYQRLHYTDIKRFVQNSIEYSFIKDPLLKSKILQDVNNKLSAFENEIMRSMK